MFFNAAKLNNYFIKSSDLTFFFAKKNDVFMIMRHFFPFDVGILQEYTKREQVHSEPVPEGNLRVGIKPTPTTYKFTDSHPIVLQR